MTKSLARFIARVPVLVPSTQVLPPSRLTLTTS